MANLNLDASIPEQVASASQLRADLGGGRSLIVLSGVARPEFGIDDDTTHRETCKVRLRFPATHIEQSTVHVSLASISNDETGFVFATDTASVNIDDSGELVLSTQLALMGEPSTLNRFSYQVVVIDRALITEVSGTLAWPTAWFRPASSDPASVSAVFDIEAKAIEAPSGAGDPVFTFLAFGTITHLAVGDVTTTADYRIGALPVDRPMQIFVNQNALQPPDADGAVMGPTTFNGDRVTLTAAQPTRADVDFQARRHGIVA